MRKLILYHKNIVQSLTQKLNPLVPIFISKNDEKKLSLVAGTDGNFRLSGDCVCSTLAQSRYCVNSSPRDQKIPSALATGDSYILTSTCYSYISTL